MANLQIKNVPQDLHAELRRRADRRSVTMRDYVLDLIRRDQEFPLAEEWLEAVNRRQPIELDRPISELIAEDRDEREQQLLARWTKCDSA